MAVNLNALAEVQTVGSNQNILLFGDNNVATRIDYDKLAEAILNKTRDEIGGVSPISAIATLQGTAYTVSWPNDTYVKIATSLETYIANHMAGIFYLWSTTNDYNTVGAPSQNAYHYFITKTNSSAAIV